MSPLESYRAWAEMLIHFMAEKSKEDAVEAFDNEGQQRLEPLALGEIPAALQGQVEKRLVYTKGETHDEQVRFWLRDLDHFSSLLSRNERKI